MPLTVFAAAREAAVRFLDDATPGFAARAQGPAPDGSADVWKLTAESAVAGITEIQLALPPSFPSTSPNVFIIGEAARRLPHMEEHSRVCLNVETFGTDYDHPHEPIRRTLIALEEFLRHCDDPAWVRAEFLKEAALYWGRFCEVEAKKYKRATVPRGVVLFDDISQTSEGRLEIQSGRNGAGRWAYVAAKDPGKHLQRHQLSIEGADRARLLFIRLADDGVWMPGEWPKNYAELELFARERHPDAASFFERRNGRGKGSGRKLVTDRFVLIATRQGAYAYQLREATLPLLEPPYSLPLQVVRMDTQWCLTRDENTSQFNRRQVKRVVVFGAGSLAAPTVDLLARAAVGHIDVVDFDLLEPENVARHSLGLDCVGMNKAKALASRAMQQIPGVQVNGFAQRAEQWLADQKSLGGIDVVVDLTGAGDVRILLSRVTQAGELKVPLVIGWMEPFGSAAHVVTLVGGDRWPDDDPVDALAAAAWPPETEIRLPGCGSGFHPYGASDAARAAALVVEKVLDALDGKAVQSSVSSFRREDDYLADLPVATKMRSWSHEAPVARGTYIEREYKELFQSSLHGTG